MQITTVTVGLTTSVKIAPYEYAKPEYSLTANLEDGDSLEQVTTELKKLVSDELSRICAILVAEQLRNTKICPLVWTKRKVSNTRARVKG